jgi:hypothetical protein
MKLNQLLITFVAIAFPIILKSLPARAFNLVYKYPANSLNYQYTADYLTPNGNKGKVWIDPLQKISPPSTGLLAAFKSQFPLYSFEASYTPIYGDFVVTSYQACPPAPYPIFCESIPDLVGGLLYLDYVPRTFFDPELGKNYVDFPNPETGKVRWVQWLTSNHKLNRNHGEQEAVVDTTSNTPYYYEKPYHTTNYTFFDSPGRVDIGWNHDWLANLYLAYEKIDSVTNATTVQIFGGVRWGWHNRVDRKKKEPSPDLVPFCPTNSSAGECEFNSFSDGLSSGLEIDEFKIPNLTPGKKFVGWIDNDIPGNQCNPNTKLETYNEYGSLMNGDNDSSPVGDGFGSALTGFVSNDGSINLSVHAANGGRRGEDKGNYELNVVVFDNEADIPFTMGDSGGGGVGRERPGGTQQNPILPNAREGNWQIFRDVPGCRWYDPHTPYGFEFQALDDTLFSEILDFAIGSDNRFTVSVGDNILGEFGAGDSVDFTSLFGSGISNFKITGIDSLFGSTEETAFPIQLAFNDRIGSFKMRPISKESSPQSTPESTSTLGLLALGAWGIVKALKIRKNK